MFWRRKFCLYFWPKFEGRSHPLNSRFRGACEARQGKDCFAVYLDCSTYLPSQNCLDWCIRMIQNFTRFIIITKSLVKGFLAARKYFGELKKVLSFLHSKQSWKFSTSIQELGVFQLDNCRKLYSYHHSFGWSDNKVIYLFKVKSWFQLYKVGAAGLRIWFTQKKLLSLSFHIYKITGPVNSFQKSLHGCWMLGVSSFRTHFQYWILH